MDRAVTDKTNLLVNYVPPCFTEDKFAEIFIPFGEIETCHLVFNKHWGRLERHNAGFGFVKFKSALDAERAKITLDGLKLCNKTLKISYAYRRRLRNTNVLVKGIDKRWNEDDLMAIMSQYGPIVATRIIYDQIAARQYKQDSSNLRGLSTGKGFVIFERQVDALNAIKDLHDTIIPHQNNRLTLKIIDRSGGEQRLLVKACEHYMLGHVFSPMRNYYVIEIRDVGPYCDTEVLHYMFSTYGVILSAFIIYEDNCTTTGCVIMENYLDAVGAILGLNLTRKKVRIFPKEFHHLFSYSY